MKLTGWQPRTEPVNLCPKASPSWQRDVRTESAIGAIL